MQKITGRFGNTSDYFETDVATAEELLTFANVIRKAGGADVLDALLPSVPSSANQCLIANALNFGCSVAPLRGVSAGQIYGTVFYNLPERIGMEWEDRSTVWGMYLPVNTSSDQLDKIASAVLFHLTYDGPFDKYASSVRIARSFEAEPVLVLPKFIGNAARAFDNGLAFRDLVCGRTCLSDSSDALESTESADG